MSNKVDLEIMKDLSNDGAIEAAQHLRSSAYVVDGSLVVADLAGGRA